MNLVLIYLLLMLLFIKLDMIQIKQRKQDEIINKIMEKTGTQEIKTETITEEIKEVAKTLKEKGKMAKAVKLIRENSRLELLEAKEYVDKL